MAASVRRATMTLLTQAVMVRANIDVNRMSAQQKVELADEIYVQQPNLLASILVLPRYGVDMLQLEVPIHVLLVAFQAMKHCGHAVPTISEDVQETACSRADGDDDAVPRACRQTSLRRMITKFASTTPSDTCWSCTATWPARPAGVRTDARKSCCWAPSTR